MLINCDANKLVIAANLTLMDDVPLDCPPRLRALLQRCFAHNPDERPSFEVSVLC
jgi:hypothetical protein